MADTEASTPETQTVDPQQAETEERLTLDSEFSRQSFRTLVNEIHLGEQIADVGGRIIDHNRADLMGAIGLPEEQQNAIAEKSEGPSDALGSVLDDYGGDSDDLDEERTRIKEDYERLKAEHPDGMPVDELRDLVDRARELGDRAEETTRDYAPRLEEINHLIIEGQADDATDTQSGHGAGAHSVDHADAGAPDAGAELGHADLGHDAASAYVPVAASAVEAAAPEATTDPAA